MIGKWSLNLEAVRAHTPPVLSADAHLLPPTAALCISVHRNCNPSIFSAYFTCSCPLVILLFRYQMALVVESGWLE
jgi:hypothetical protein